MKTTQPIFESDEIRVYGFVDEMVVHFTGPCYCGDPGLPSQEPGEMIHASGLLGSNKGETVIVDILGDSMIDADIRRGDMVTINRQAEPRDGDIVLASIDGMVTLKFLQHDREGRTWLVPANEKYAPFRVDFDGETSIIIGVMVSLVRPRPKFDAMLRGRLEAAIDEMYPLLHASEPEKPFCKYIPSGKDKKQILARLHAVLDGQDGVAIVKTLVAAKAISYITTMPTLGLLKSEFNVKITKSQYYRDKDKRYDENEIRDIIEVLK